jgi:hypothetical protein
VNRYRHRKFLSYLNNILLSAYSGSAESKGDFLMAFGNLKQLCW